MLFRSQIFESFGRYCISIDTDIVYQRPKKGKEVILDLSKPEVQDAEMIDDEDK